MRAPRQKKPGVKPTQKRLCSRPAGSCFDSSRPRALYAVYPGSSIVFEPPTASPVPRRCRDGFCSQPCQSLSLPGSSPPRRLAYFRFLVCLCLVYAPIEGVSPVVLPSKGGQPGFARTRTPDRFLSGGALFRPLQLLAPSLAPASSSSPLKHLRLLVTRELKETLDSHASSEGKREKNEDDSLSRFSPCSFTRGLVLTILPSRKEGLPDLEHLGSPRAPCPMPDVSSSASLGASLSSLSAASASPSSASSSAPSAFSSLPLFVLDVSPADEPSQRQASTSALQSSCPPSLVPSSSALAGTAAAACCCDALVLPLSYANLAHPLSLTKQELPQLLLFSTAVRQQLALCQAGDALAPVSACPHTSPASTPGPHSALLPSSTEHHPHPGPGEQHARRGETTSITCGLEGQVPTSAERVEQLRVEESTVGAPSSARSVACRRKPLIVIVTDYFTPASSLGTPQPSAGSTEVSPAVSDVIVFSLDTPEPVPLQVPSSPGAELNRAQEAFPAKERSRWGGSPRWNRRLGVKAASNEEESRGQAAEHRLAALAVRHVLEAVWRDLQLDAETSRGTHAQRGTGQRSSTSSSRDGGGAFSVSKERDTERGKDKEEHEKLPRVSPSTTARRQEGAEILHSAEDKTSEANTQRGSAPPGSSVSSSALLASKMKEQGGQGSLSEKGTEIEALRGTPREQAGLQLSSLYSVYVVLVPATRAQSDCAHGRDQEEGKPQPSTALSRQLRHVIQSIVCTFRRDEFQGVSPSVHTDPSAISGGLKNGGKDLPTAKQETSCDATVSNSGPSANASPRLNLTGADAQGSSTAHGGGSEQCRLSPGLLLGSLPLVAEACFGALSDSATGRTLRPSFLRGYGKVIETEGEVEGEDKAEDGRRRSQEGFRSARDVAAAAGQISRTAVEGVRRMLENDEMKAAAGRRVSWAFDIHRLKEATKQRWVSGASFVVCVSLSTYSPYCANLYGCDRLD